MYPGTRKGTVLYNQRRHYEPPLVAWNKTTVTNAIKITTITKEVIEQATSGGKWIKHPLDEGGQIKSDFYFGRSGALWAVDYLQRAGAIRTTYDVTQDLDQLLLENRKYRKTLYRKQANRMLADWEHVKGTGYVWNVDIYQYRRQILGPVHGFTGNAFALISGFHLLTKKQVKQITRRVMATIVNTADTNDRHANWWPSLQSDKSGKERPLIQFCHGAPGIIIPLASLPAGLNPQFDEVLLKGGELIWDAGLLEKGPGLCHGTSGNGYAFLKLYKRTGDDMWLKRAKEYAMHSIKQYNEIKAHYKKTRYPLWTGDPGIAIYLWDCLQGNADFPTLDVF